MDTLFMIIGFIVIPVLIVFFSLKISGKKKLEAISISSDVDALFAFMDSGNKAEVREAAENRLTELVKTTTDPDEFVRIALKLDNRDSFHVDLTERFSPEDLLKIKTKMYIPDSIVEAAAEQVHDQKILAETYENIIAFRETELIRHKILEKITDRDVIYSLALNHPEWVNVVSRLDEDQKSRFGMDCCRNGHHDWEVETDDNYNEELDIRGYIQTRRCRRCGRTVIRDHDDAHGTTEEVTYPGLFGK